MISQSLSALVFLLCCGFISSDKQDEVDEEGYMMYCPCMGRFGNQAEHFLGALAFAQALNRTLVLPPWIEYDNSHRGSVMVPFDKYFNVSVVNQYHKAVTMEYFFKELASKIWPAGERFAFCYGARRGPHPNSCNAKDGNPFGPFWDNFDVNFDRSEIYGPLSFDVHHQDAGEKWKMKYPVGKFPVIAFTGAPATFPVQEQNTWLQRYLVYNDRWIQKARDWIRDNLPEGPYVGIHLRNGIDWGRACEHVASTKQLFSSPQCLGYRNEHGDLTADLCMPSHQTIINNVKKAVKFAGAKSIFVASDNDFMLSILRTKVRGVTVHRTEVDQPHLDLALLSLSDYFVGNCVSSFTGFVKRTRDVTNLPTAFWAFASKNTQHKEL